MCFWHDPDTTLQREHARRTGGLRRHLNKGNNRDRIHIRKMSDVKRVWELLLNDTWYQENSIGRTKSIIDLLKFGKQEGFYKSVWKDSQTDHDYSGARKKLIAMLNGYAERRRDVQEIVDNYKSNLKEDNT